MLLPKLLSYCIPFLECSFLALLLTRYFYFYCYYLLLLTSLLLIRMFLFPPLRRLSFLALFKDIFHFFFLFFYYYFHRFLFIFLFFKFYVFKNIASIINILIISVTVIIILQKHVIGTYFVGFFQPSFAFIPTSLFSNLFMHGIGVCSFAIVLKLLRR